MKYVLGFLFDLKDDTVLLVRKNRPTWQEGLLNGIGGKIENGEEPLEAMIREFKEEVGYEQDDWNHFLTCKFSGEEKSKMYCFKIFKFGFDNPKAINDVGENILKIPMSSIYTRTDKMQNLQWMIPLALHEPGDSKTKFKDSSDG